MGARYYSPKYSAFTSVDPMAAYRSWISPYNYVQNNPIMRQDPTGMLDHGPGGPSDEKLILGSEGERGPFEILNEYLQYDENEQRTQPSENVVIDPGHGGDDPGTPKRNGNKNEADINLSLAKKIAKRLQELNKSYYQQSNTYLTRSTDINPGGKGQPESLKARVKFSKEKKPKLLLVFMWMLTIILKQTG